MARKQSQIAQLRSTVLAQHNSATGKVNRLKKSKGVNLAGTEYDKRRDLDKVKHYNSAQLKKYSEELSGFMDRGRQYVAGIDGKPLPRGLVSQYKAIETRYNSNVNKAFDAVKDINLPNQDGTLADRMAEMMPTRNNKSARPVNAAYKPPVRDASSINGAKALQTLIDDYKKRSNPNYKKKQLNVDKRSFIQSLKDAGLDARNAYGRSKEDAEKTDIVKMVFALTDEQFATVWQYTNLAGAVFLNYESLRAEQTGEGEPLSSKSYDDNYDEVRDLLKWARLL